MKISVESTTKVVYLDGIQCRIWEGQTENGVSMHCYIARVAVKDDLDRTQFETELRECREPSYEVQQAIPMRMIL